MRSQAARHRSQPNWILFCFWRCTHRSVADRPETGILLEIVRFVLTDILHKYLLLRIFASIFMVRFQLGSRPMWIVTNTPRRPHIRCELHNFVNKPIFFYARRENHLQVRRDATLNVVFRNVHIDSNMWSDSLGLFTRVFFSLIFLSRKR